MKRFLCLCALFASLTSGIAGAAVAESPTETTKALSVGDVVVYDYGDIRLHAYRTGDNMSDECYVLESGEGLVLLESTAYKENVAAFSEYVRSLGKPLAGAFLSYHSNGYKSYDDVTIYATKKALASWGEGGGVKALTDSFVQAFGDKVAADLPSEADAKIQIVEEGQTLTVAGIEFKILATSDGDDYGVEIPAIKAVYRHMMGSKVHNILPAIPYIEAEIADLKGYQAKGYRLVLTSHHTPEGPEAVAEKIAYLEKVKELAASCKTKDEFIAAMKAAFPGYAGENYLEMSAGALYK